jgi:hypothetical protein
MRPASITTSQSVATENLASKARTVAPVNAIAMVDAIITGDNAPVTRRQSTRPPVNLVLGAFFALLGLASIALLVGLDLREHGPRAVLLLHGVVIGAAGAWGAWASGFPSTGTRAKPTAPRPR